MILKNAAKKKEKSSHIHSARGLPKKTPPGTRSERQGNQRLERPRVILNEPLSATTKDRLDVQQQQKTDEKSLSSRRQIGSLRESLRGYFPSKFRHHTRAICVHILRAVNIMINIVTVCLPRTWIFQWCVTPHLCARQFSSRISLTNLR